MDEQYLSGFGQYGTLGKFPAPPWFGGHYACAVIAAYYVCRDNRIDQETQHALRLQVDRMMDMITATFDGLCRSAVMPEEGLVLFQGHAMTWAHALVMLARLGFSELARDGYDAQRLYLEEAVNLDPEGRGPKVTTSDHPFTAKYWSKNFEALERSWEFGHVFKYLYSFYDLIGRVPEPETRQECERRLLYLI